MNPLAEINWDDLNETAAQRPAGYREEVLALAVGQNETHVILNRADYNALRHKYRGEEPTGFDGSALWSALHTATEATQAVIDDVTAGLTCGPCKSGWLAMLAATPPPLGDLPAFRAWGVDRHSEVSLKIGKPAFTYAQAAARWGWET